jgi:phosphoglycerate dehydrogenase-like enzyme
MTRRSFWPLLLLCAAFASQHALASTPSPAAQALIAELGLTPSATPISKHPSWQPQRVVVMLLPAMGTATTEFEQELKQAAGDVELIFDRSGGFVVPAKLLAGADAVIGICTPPLLQSADARLLWIHNYSVGMEHCTGLSENQRQHMVFSNNKRLSGPAIAEHAIAMLLALTHNLPAYQKAIPFPSAN